jgi:uncharacterized protein YcgI (DUF1989 family)
MPLLMIEPSPAPLPAETELIVSGGEVGCVRVASGQLLAVTDIEGSQPAGLFAFASDDPGQFLSPHHTRVFSNSFMLRLGMRLVTNRRRPAMVLGRDPVGTHDLLMPITEASAHGATGGADQFRAKVAAAFGAAGIAPLKIPDPVNLFLDVAVEANGSLVPRGVASQPGDTVVFRVVMDLMIAVAAPYPDPVLWDREKPGPIALRVRNEVASL